MLEPEQLLVQDFLRYKRESYLEENGLTNVRYQELIEFALYIYATVIDTGVDSSGNVLSENDLNKVKELHRRLSIELELSKYDNF